MGHSHHNDCDEHEEREGIDCELLVEDVTDDGLGGEGGHIDGG